MYFPCVTPGYMTSLSDLAEAKPHTPGEVEVMHHDSKVTSAKGAEGDDPNTGSDPDQKPPAGPTSR